MLDTSSGVYPIPLVGYTRYLERGILGTSSGVYLVPEMMLIGYH